MKVLIVGAKAGSLGDAVRVACTKLGMDTVTVGISDEEEYPLSVTDPDYKIVDTLVAVRPDHIVVTAGINLEPQESGGLAMSYRDHFMVNCIGPMRILESWRLVRSGIGEPGHFVAISSNSAQIPRSGSAPYCASKAALSMAIRSASRDLARGHSYHGVIAYAYEPGWLEGTPMSNEVAGRYPDVAPHRMLGLEAGVSPANLAAMIARNLRYGGRELNGCALRIDAGEQ